MQPSSTRVCSAEPQSNPTHCLCVVQVLRVGEDSWGLLSGRLDDVRRELPPMPHARVSGLAAALAGQRSSNAAPGESSSVDLTSAVLGINLWLLGRRWLPPPAVPPRSAGRAQQSDSIHNRGPWHRGRWRWPCMAWCWAGQRRQGPRARGQRARRAGVEGAGQGPWRQRRRPGRQGWQARGSRPQAAPTAAVPATDCQATAAVPATVCQAAAAVPATVCQAAAAAATCGSAALRRAGGLAAAPVCRPIASSPAHKHPRPQPAHWRQRWRLPELPLARVGAPLGTLRARGALLWWAACCCSD
jgi:hypothetical protein